LVVVPSGRACKKLGQQSKGRSEGVALDLAVNKRCKCGILRASQGDEGETLPFVLIGKENTRKEESGSQVSLMQRKK
jgi:hypothetical protein